MFSSLILLDKKLSHKVHNTQLGRFDYILAVFALCCSYIGVPIFLTSFYCLIGSLFAILYLKLVLSGLLITTVLKKLTRRSRPHRHAKRLINLRWLESNLSFPSGDSYQAGCLAMFLVHHFGSNLFISFIPLVMFARVYFGFHWIGDTLMGSLIGVMMTQYLLTVY